jgi:hypothetical protein
VIRSFLRKGAVSKEAACLATGAPNQPGGLTATGGVGTISLSWTADATAAPNQATYYEVERSIDGLGSWSVIATNLGTNSYTDTVAASTTRHYRVTAYNCDSGSLASTSASAKTAPAAPSSLTATATSSTQINLAWTDNSSDETGFIIQQRSPSGSGSWSTIHTTGAGATSYSVTGLTASTNYGFRVAATRTSPSGTSGYTAEASATTQAAASTYSIATLVVAGGGGGGRGGGGGGGVRYQSSLSLTVGQNYSVTIGAGGATNQQGNTSSFSTVSCTGGGYGGNAVQTGGNGGSGGGGGSGNYTTQNGGNGTTGEGYAGGGTDGFNAGNFCSGGGGGAGQVGQNVQSNSVAGNGGDGLQSSISGSAKYYGGGGGGSTGNAGTCGTGGQGGGGAGVSAGGAGNAGTANTGGGAGGRGYDGYLTPGGSGVVILRMATANYSGTTTGSPTVTTSGSDTILTFNASGSYTA